MNRSIHYILWACVIGGVALSWYYGLRLDLTGDSGLYAAISRQMVESGNWLDLRINGRPYDQKPHLFFWLAGAGIKLFGASNFGYKFFLFLSGIASIFFTWKLGKLIYSRTAGILAALFVGTSQIYFLYFFDIHTDTVLQSCVILSLWQFARYMKYEKPVGFLFAFAGTGLAMLTKGPVGAVLPFFFVLFYFILKKDYNQLFRPIWFAGILVVLIIISPSLLHLWRHFGMEGIRFYFIDNNLGRVSGKVAGSSTDPFFYLYNLLWALLPWTVPVLLGLYYELKSWITRKNIDYFGAALLGGVLVLFIVYSIARGKAPNYIMMLIPPIAVVAAGRITEVVTRSGSRQSVILPIQYVLLSLMIVVMVLVWIFIIPEQKPYFLLLVLGLGLIVCMVYFRIQSASIKRALFFSVVVISMFNLYLNVQVLPVLFSYQGAPQVLATYNERRMPDDSLYLFELEEYQMFFYPESITEIREWDHLFEILEVPGSWVYTNKIKYDELIRIGYEFDQVYEIRQRGMNRINIHFLIHSTREQSLRINYLVKVK